MDYVQYFAERIEQLKGRGDYREFADLERQSGNFPKAWLNRPDGRKEITIWCTNDYLGMGQHPKVLLAMKRAIDANGAGSGGSRNIGGTNHYHVLLERELADFHNKEAGLIFVSGFSSNDSSLSTLASLMPNTVIFSDAHNHASIISGCRNSRAEKRVFRHNDVAHLRELLGSVNPARPKIVVFESIYSMDGDISPIKDICDMADEFGAMTFLDEVHASGMYGPKGAGIAAELGIMNRPTIIEGTLGKAFGSMGGYLTGPASIVDSIRSFSTGFIFTTALAPAVAAGALAALRHLRDSDSERIALRRQTNLLIGLLKEAGIPVMPTESHIIPVLIGDPFRCKEASRQLLDHHGIYLQPILAPSVPAGTERFRVTVTPAHSTTDIRKFVDALRQVLLRDNLGKAA
ncbi:5-aminolevulinate synthase [Mesorhizobium sp. M0195]|uniref:5-aminolevulinate synthase n=1 Tax=Mesorhizobium sp. M0195 TaxID=2956910 RepID=UPI0033358163